MTYDELVQGINKRLVSGEYHEAFTGKPGLPMEEVNAWTYWQGYGVRHPRIVVLGQDWGSISASEKFFHAIDDMITGKSPSDRVNYFKYAAETGMETKEFTTDLNLVSGCEVLGYDDILHEKYEDLFFTNLIPGFRTESTSTGGFKAAWVNEQVKKDFRDLIEILQPQVILCLGKDVYRQAAAIFGYKRVLNGKGWNSFLDDAPAPLALHGESGHVSYLFAMPHPGYYGEMNRKKSAKGKTMKDDWTRIRTWLEQNPWNV